MRAILVGVLFIVFNHLIAQEYKADVAYKYMLSNKWDKAVQTYNYSRTFLEEKQPLLMHGLNSSLSYIFKSSKKFKSGLNFSYSYFNSSAENENFNNTFNLHFLNLGYLFHYENYKKNKGLYADIIISAVSSMLNRTINEVPFEYDETRVKAFGIGGDVSVKAGYYLNLKNKIFLSPFVLVGYTPYFYSPNSEAVFNQTKGLVNNNWTEIFTTQIGLSFHIRDQKNE